MHNIYMLLRVENSTAVRGSVLLLLFYIFLCVFLQPFAVILGHFIYTQNAFHAFQTHKREYIERKKKQLVAQRAVYLIHIRIIQLLLI